MLRSSARCSLSFVFLVLLPAVRARDGAKRQRLNAIYCMADEVFLHVEVLRCAADNQNITTKHDWVQREGERERERERDTQTDRERERERERERDRERETLIVPMTVHSTKATELLLQSPLAPATRAPPHDPLGRQTLQRRC